MSHHGKDLVKVHATSLIPRNLRVTRDRDFDRPDEPYGGVVDSIQLRSVVRNRVLRRRRLSEALAVMLAWSGRYYSRFSPV